jgi:ATP-dependent RNA helicase SUPV3L1/SUV3
LAPEVGASEEVAETAAPVTEPSSENAVEATAAAEPELVEVWRPGGRSEERRPRHDRSRYKGPDKSAAAPSAGEAAGGTEDKRGERHGQGRHRRRDRLNDNYKPRTDAPAAAAAGNNEAAQARPPRDDKGGRPPREHFKDRNQDRGKGKFDKSKGGRDGRKDDRGGGSHRTYATSAPPRERDRPADPNSPFAKLAALKEQLAGNRKD